MLSGFQQQEPMTNFSFPKAAPPPQHGQKADKLCKKIGARPVPPPQPGR